MKNCLITIVALVSSAGLAQLSLGQARIAQDDFLAMYLYNGKDEARFKQHLEQRTELQIDQIRRLTQLDESQEAKLRLAARGDLSRFYRDMEHVRQELKDADPRNGNDMQRAWQAIQPLQKRLATGVTDESSLMGKVLSTVLTPEQAEQYRAHQRQRQLYLYKSILRMSIADLEKTLPLTTQQRTDLIKLLEEKNFPVGCPAEMTANVGYAMLARLSQAEQQQLFDAEQQKVFNLLSERYVQIMNNFTW